MSDQYIKINYLSLLKRKKKTAKKINFLKQQQQSNRCLPIKLATVSLGVPAGPSSSDLSTPLKCNNRGGKRGEPELLPQTHLTVSAVGFSASTASWLV